MRKGLAEWLHQRLSASLAIGLGPSDGLSVLLQHATALLRADHDQQLWLPLANFLLYDARDRLVSLGRLDWVNAALTAVSEWLNRFPDVKAAESEWERERSVCVGFLGNVAIAQGNLPDAQNRLSETARIQQRLAESDPANAEWQRDLVVSHYKLAHLAQDNGDDAGFEAELRECFQVLDRMKQRGLHFDPQMAQVYDQLTAMFAANP